MLHAWICTCARTHLHSRNHSHSFSRKQNVIVWVLCINRSNTSIFISILLLTNFCESESIQKYTYLLKNRWAKLYWNFKSCFVLLFRFNSVLILNSNAVTQKKYKIYVFWYIIWFVIWHAWKQNDTQNIQYNGYNADLNWHNFVMNLHKHK